MGLTSSKRKHNESFTVPARVSPFGRFSRRNSLNLNDSCGVCGPRSLLDLGVDAVSNNLHKFPLTQLRALPTDLSQILLNQLIDTGRLNDASILRMAGLTFHAVKLDAYSEPIRDFWLRYLATSALEIAVIRCSTMDDQVLAALPWLPHLHTLHLEICPNITDTGLVSALRGLPALRDLSLAGCASDGITSYSIEWISRLPSLTALNLSECRHVSCLDGALSKLRNLVKLDLGWCGGIGDLDVKALENLTNLQELDISHTRITSAGLVYLYNLNKLVCLSLSGLGVKDHAVAALLQRLPLLKTLDLSRCMSVEDSTLRAIGGCCLQLQDLDVSYTEISDDGMEWLKDITGLKKLNLDSCGVGDRGIDVVSKFPALEFLDLSDTTVTGNGISAFKHLHNLQTLNLSFTEIDNAALRKLTGLKNLKKLNLDSRQFNDTAIEHVAKLPNLEKLDLFGASITDAGCTLLSAMSKLTSLELCSGAITDIGVARLSSLSNLRHLNLGQNFRITNAAIPQLIKLQHLTALNLAQCRVTSNSIVALGCLGRLETLALHNTRVKYVAVEKLRAMNENLVVLGVDLPGGVAR